MSKSEQKQIGSVVVWLLALPYAIWKSKKISITLKVVAIAVWVLVLVLTVTLVVNGVQSSQNETATTPTVAGVDSNNTDTLLADKITSSSEKDALIASLIKTKSKQLFDVTSVVDGDTIKISQLGTLRLIGMDTPETKDPRKPVQCFGKEASERAKKLLTGTKVYLEFDPGNSTDKYNRTLAYVYREDGYFYNLEMVRDGYAHSYVQYPHPKLDEFNAAQKQARTNQSGFWSPDSCNGDTVQAAKR